VARIQLFINDNVAACGVAASLANGVTLLTAVAAKKFTAWQRIQYVADNYLNHQAHSLNRGSVAVASGAMFKQRQCRERMTDSARRRLCVAWRVAEGLGGERLSIGANLCMCVSASHHGKP